MEVRGYLFEGAWEVVLTSSGLASQNSPVLVGPGQDYLLGCVGLLESGAGTTGIRKCISGFLVSILYFHHRYWEEDEESDCKSKGDYDQHLPSW